MPIDARKVARKNRTIEISLGEKSVKVPGWEWKLEKPMRLSEIRRLRLCFHGKGIVEPWDDCESYRPRFGSGRLACQLGDVGCPSSDECRKHKPMGYIV